tara:strand:+ start:1134 stop:2066 length:933 start_codon:yes stop_codon:yes gene_type:complete
MSNDNKTSDIAMKEWLRTAKTISEALPYLKEFSGETFVIKFGGHAMVDEELSLNFARDVVLLKHVGINPIIIHGGGPQIDRMLDQLGIKTNFIDGLRITDAKTIEIAEMVLSGSINKDIVSSIGLAGGIALGLSGKDGNLIQCEKLIHKNYYEEPNKNPDLGFVGKPKTINTTVLEELIFADIIPVIAPIGLGVDGNTYNINADTCAGAIASAMSAAKLIMMTDVPGVMGLNSEIINKIDAETAEELIRNKVIKDGMIPKVETCLDAINNNVAAAHILDGRVPHVLLLEIFTQHGTGTMMLDQNLTIDSE